MNTTTFKNTSARYTVPKATYFSYRFTPTENIISVAINDLKNKTATIGGNVVYIAREIEFSTSTSFFGIAYTCPQPIP
jgi:hypothetical protein